MIAHGDVPVGCTRACRRDPVAVLGAQPLFGALPDAELVHLAERSVCRRIAAGTVLFREGNPCRGLYLVLDGAVSVYRSNLTGATQTLRVAEAGESLGEVSLFDGGPYLGSARVVRDSHLLFLPLEEVHALYARHPEVARGVVSDLGGRLRGLIALVDRLSLQQIPARVAAAIAEYGRASGDLRSGTTFRMPRTQEELAAEIGASRESVARALKRLREAGVIRQRGRTVEVRDPETLRTWGSR